MKNRPLKHLIIIFLSFFVFAQPVFAGPPPDLVGQSAILIDRTTGAILYQKNANLKMYPASTTKILTSILCIENVDLAGPMTKTIDSVNSIPLDSSHIGLKLGDVFPIIDGLHAVMLGSDNYVSHDLAVLLDGSTQNFAHRMNLKAKQIGAHNSHFVNPHGYHDPDHYTTAHDLARIMDYALKNNTFCSIIKSPNYTLSRVNDLDHPIEFSNTVKLLDPESEYYRPYIIGGKTGFTNAAGRSLVAVASQNGMDLIGVVLKSENPGFFEDMNHLFDYGFENFELQKEGKTFHLKNKSFSPWAKEIVDFSLEHKLLDPHAKNYQMPISKEDFINLLMQTSFVAQNKDVEGFSKNLGIHQALVYDLIQSTSLLSGFNSPITRESAAFLTAKLLEAIGFNPVKVYPASLYEDQRLISNDYRSFVYLLQQNGIMGSPHGGPFNPQENLTLEQGLSVASQFYKIYSHSIHSYIHSYKKTTLI